MTIDKFGRSRQKHNGDASKGPKGEGFNLTPDGDYDMQSKRLCNLKRPLADDDAVSKRFMKENTVFLNDKGYFDANNSILQHLASPLNADDAVTKSYVDYKTIPFTSEHYFMGNKMLRGVRDGIEGSDAVNLSMLKSQTEPSLKLVDSNYYNCQSKQLKYCGEPTALDDAVNINYIVRVLSQVLYNVYTDLGSPLHMEKDAWIKKHVVKKYFLGRRFRKKDIGRPEDIGRPDVIEIPVDEETRRIIMETDDTTGEKSV